MKKLLTLALASGALAAGSASALTVSFSDSFSGITPEVLTTSPFSFTLGMFDVSTLGPTSGTWVLDQVDVTFSMSMMTVGTVTNTSGADVPFATVDLGATGIDLNNSLGATFSWTGLSDGLVHQELYTNWLNGETRAFGPGSDGWNPLAFSSTSAGDLALFTGVGTWTDTVTALGATASSGITNFAQAVNTTVGGNMQVVYTYHEELPPPPPPLPVPAPLTLLGLGLAGLAVSARRRKS